MGAQEEEAQASEEQKVNEQEDKESKKSATLSTTQKVVLPEMQAIFYEVLFDAVLPLFEQSEHLKADQLYKLLQRSKDIKSSLLDQILATEKDALKHDLVDCQ